VILLVCVLVPCGTYFPKGAEPANSQERRRGKGACQEEKFLEGDPELGEGGGVQNPEGARVFIAVPQGESAVRFRGCPHG
jgi:hypothetical protein